MAGRMILYADVRQKNPSCSRKFAEDVQEAFRGEGAVSVRKQITQRQKFNGVGENLARGRPLRFPAI